MCRLPALSNGKPGLAALTGRTQFGTVVKLLEASPAELSAALAYNCSHQVWVLPGSGRWRARKSLIPKWGLSPDRDSFRAPETTGPPGSNWWISNGKGNIA